MIDLKNILLSILLSILAPGLYAQVEPVSISETPLKKSKSDKRSNAFKSSTLHPYVDFLVGLNHMRSTRGSYYKPNIGMRGGLFIYEPMLLGTGVDIFAARAYTSIVNVPLELGYQLPNHPWQFTSSIGLAFEPYRSGRTGRTATVDAFWRPNV